MKHYHPHVIVNVVLMIIDRLYIHIKSLLTAMLCTCALSAMDNNEIIFDQLPDLLKNNNLEQLQSLISRDNIHIHDAYHNNVLHYAASYGTADAGKIFIDYGAEINQKGYLGNAPLHYAVSTHNTSMTELLLNQNNINVNIQDNSGDTPLHAALQEHWNNIIDVYKKDKETQLHILNIEKNILIIIDWLLGRGAHQSIKNKDERRVDQQIEINGSKSRPDHFIYQERFTLYIHSLLLYQRLYNLKKELKKKT